MSREIKRVPLDFSWPEGKVWGGFIRPSTFDEIECKTCGGSGYSPYAEHLRNLWYGQIPFSPADNGSTPWTHESPPVRAFAERNVANAPEFYGMGERAIVNEARRLARLFNSSWSYNLTQAEVDILVTEEMPRDLTHTWVKDEGWKKIDPPPVITAEDFNNWSITAFGSSGALRTLTKHKCAEVGEPYECQSCDGHGSTEAYAGQREAGEAWEWTYPPEGEGYQLWESVSEGSPISPVFADREGMVGYLMSPANSWGISQPLTREQAEAFVGAGHSVASFVLANGKFIDGSAAVHELKS